MKHLDIFYGFLAVILSFVAILSFGLSNPMILWINLSVLVVLGAAFGCVYYYFKLRKIVPHGILCGNAIRYALYKEGYKVQDPEPDEREKNGWEVVRFKDQGIVFEAVYNSPIFSINYLFTSTLDLQRARQIAEAVMNEMYVAKISVVDLSDRPGQIGVKISSEILLYYTDEFYRQLPACMSIIAKAARQFAEFAEQSDSQNTQSLRRRDIYNQEYGWFAEAVDAVTAVQLKPEALTDEALLRAKFQQDCAPSMQAEWDAFRIVRVDNYGNYKLILYQFPEPKEVPEALYGAVLLDTTTNHADYYTLEYSYNGKWVYGSTSRGKHLNYGEVDTPDLDVFVAWIFSSDKQLRHLTDLHRNNSETVN